MSKESYAEMLKDPRWQRKRLEVLEYWDFRCSHCGSRDKTLHVHHGSYDVRLDPWEYDHSMLHCLCNDCHEMIHGAVKAIRWIIGELPLYQVNALTTILLGFKNYESREYVQSASIGFASLLGLDANATEIMNLITELWQNRTTNARDCIDGF